MRWCNYDPLTGTVARVMPVVLKVVMLMLGLELCYLFNETTRSWTSNNENNVKE